MSCGKFRTYINIFLTFICNNLWIIPLFFSLFVYYPYVLHIGPDLVGYIAEGYLFLTAPESISRMQRPTPSILLALPLLFSKNPFYSVLVIRIFYIINTQLVFFITKHISNRFVALMASLLVLFSYISIWSRFAIDVFLGFFILFFILCTLKLLKTRKRIFVLLASISVTFAMFTKAYAIVFIAYPLCCWFFRFFRYFHG